MYCQVCYILGSPEIIEREFSSLEAITDNYEKIVVSLDDLSLGNRNGVRHVLLWDML